MLISILTWLHILMMVGAFGVLLGTALTPLNTESSRRLHKIASPLLAVGFIIGFALYFVNIKAGIYQSQAHSLIATKILLLIAALGFLGIGSKKLKDGQTSAANTLRWLSIISLISAALLGVLV